MKSDQQIAQQTRPSTEFYEGERVEGTPFRVVARIGQGGMGSVYEVEHVELGKRFVLKALLDQFSQRQDLVQRLRNEWKSLGRLEHPNIVSVSHAGVAANGVPFYVMERLIGETVAGALQRLGRLSLQDSLRIAAEVLEGLQAAHEIGIVHRDVKPPNIFLTRHGAVKLLDFGIAKLTDGAAANLDLTGRGIAIGTPRYMSPEQAAGERVDGRADLYAVGLVLFEMLSGCGPFDGCESHEVFLAHLTRQPPRLTTMLEGIPAEVEAFVGALLAKRTVDRPQSAGVAAAALRSMLRTYCGRDSAPDTHAHEMSGVQTPLMRDSYLPPSLPPPAQYLAVAAYAESDLEPRAAVGGGVAGALNNSADAAGQGGLPPISGLGQNWALAGQRMSPLASKFGAGHEPVRQEHGAAVERWARDGSGGNVNSVRGVNVAPTSAPGPYPDHAVTGSVTLGARYETTPGPLSNSAPPGSLRPRSLFRGDVRVRHLAALSFVVVGAAGVAGWLARAPLPSTRPVAPGMAPLGAAAGYVAEPEQRAQVQEPRQAPSLAEPHVRAGSANKKLVRGDGISTGVSAQRAKRDRGAERETSRSVAAPQRATTERPRAGGAARTQPDRRSAMPERAMPDQAVPDHQRSAVPSASPHRPRLPGSGLPGAD